MRRTAATLALAATGVFVAIGAGSGDGSAATLQGSTVIARARVATVPAAPAAIVSLTKAQAVALAQAVNLRAGDVAGFKLSSERSGHQTPAETRSEGGLARCARGVSRSGQLVEASSKAFEREGKSGVEWVQSGVSVARSAALAAEELAAVRSQRGRACILHFVTALLEGHRYGGGRIGHVSLSFGSPSAPGSAGAFALRIATTITVHGVSLPFYLDFLGFVYGPAEVTLAAFSLPEPFPAADEERLFGLLLTRAKAYRA